MSPSRLSALLFAVGALAPLTALAQRCSTATLTDTVCDCGCGANDPACPAGSDFTVCATSACPAGQVPWEHTPSQCMSSACGDGWNDPAAGEVCDDGNALASGGCSADCRSVSAGSECAAGAGKCRLVPVDAGSPGVDAGIPDAGPAPVPDAGPSLEADAGRGATPPVGCSTVPASALVALLAFLGRRRLLTASRAG